MCQFITLKIKTLSKIMQNKKLIWHWKLCQTRHRLWMFHTLTELKFEFYVDCDIRLWFWLLLKLIQIWSNRNETCAESRPRFFHSSQKKERRENWINVVQYPNCPHMTLETDGRETMWRIWAKRERIRPVHTGQRASGHGQNPGLTWEVVLNLLVQTSPWCLHVKPALTLWPHWHKVTPDWVPVVSPLIPPPPQHTHPSPRPFAPPPSCATGLPG